MKSEAENRDLSGEYRLELYKKLRDEASMYVEKVPGLWLQKFALVGAVIAFIVGKHSDLAGAPQGSLLLIAATLAVPILACLLDAKILEYGLHARAVSKFIEKNFDESPALPAWESSLWGDAGDHDIVSLVRLRSLTTVAITLLPTVVLIILSGLVVNELADQNGWCISVAIALSAVYTISGYVIWKMVWPRNITVRARD